MQMNRIHSEKSVLRRGRGGSPFAEDGTDACEMASMSCAFPECFCRHGTKGICVNVGYPQLWIGKSSLRQGLKGQERGHIAAGVGPPIVLRVWESQTHGEGADTEQNLQRNMSCTQRRMVDFLHREETTN
jgi:hypothetical protein